MCCSGLAMVTPAGGVMSPATASPLPLLRRYMTTGSSYSLVSTMPLMFSRISVTSSWTPGRVVNSCRAPEIRTEVTAAPGMELSSVRRSELPSV